MKKMIMRAVNFLFPARCIFCGRLLPLLAREMICLDCENGLPYAMAGNRCGRCGKPVKMKGGLCEHCRRNPYPAYKKISSPYLYKDSVRYAMLRFKRKKHRSFAWVFARRMKAVCDYDCPNVTFDFVVSVPPRAERMRKEGYDQAKNLAQTLARQMGIPYLWGAMKQKTQRKKQSDLSYEERIVNAKGNYRVRRIRKVSGKTILLVDDICTTRATLQECAAALKAAKAAAVYCVTAATTE